MATKFNLTIEKSKVTLLVVLLNENIREECGKNGIDIDRPFSLKKDAKNVLLTRRSEFDDKEDFEDIQPDYARAIQSAGITFKTIQAFVEQQN